MSRVFLALGVFCVGLGSAAAMVSVLPTPPFLLLAALFSKSSPRAEAWLRKQSLYPHYVQVYHQEGPLPLKIWVGIVATVSVIWALSFFLMKNPIGGSPSSSSSWDTGSIFSHPPKKVIKKARTAGFFYWSMPRF